MKSKKTRERILDASLELFNLKKASNVSTVQISAAMKISPGNLYYYYANKEEVIRCIWEERMKGELENLLEMTKKADDAKALYSCIEACIKHMIAYRFFYTELSTLFVNDEQLIVMYSGMHCKFRESIGDFFIKWTETGFANDVDYIQRDITAANCIAVASQMLDRYDVYSAKGVDDDRFIAINWLRFITILDGIFTDEAKAALYDEMADRGFTRDQYMELKGF